MKTTFFKTALIVLLTTFAACSHDDDNNQSAPAPTPAANGFTWKENGSATVHTAASATFSTQYKTLMAKDASNATLFEINLSGTVPATYAIGAGNAFTYVAAAPYFTADSGNVIVTANGSGKASGTFGVAGNSGGITAIQGTFTNITVVP